VNFNGFDANAQFLRHFTSARALADQLEHFEFAIGQGFNRGLILVSARKGIEDARRNILTDVSPAGENSTDSFNNFFASLLLHDVAASTGA